MVIIIITIKTEDASVTPLETMYELTFTFVCTLKKKRCRHGSLKLFPFEFVLKFQRRILKFKVMAHFSNDDIFCV